MGLSRVVDFGHVFSMELEMAMLNDDKLFHGEAVAIDMAFSSVLAHVRGHLDADTLRLILDAMVGLRLPVYHAHFDSAMTAEALYERIKFSQGQKIPLPAGPASHLSTTTSPRRRWTRPSSCGRSSARERRSCETDSLPSERSACVLVV